MLGDDDALPHAVVTTLTDITERRVAEQEVLRLNAALEQRVEARTMELREAIKELEAFSYSVSHDLQAPLRHIEGHASLLARELEHPSEQVQKRLVSISRCVRKMGQLLGDMLRLSRTSRANLQLRPIDPAILVRDIIAAVRRISAPAQRKPVRGHRHRACDRQAHCNETRRRSARRRRRRSGRHRLRDVAPGRFRSPGVGMTDTDAIYPFTTGEL